MSDRSTGGRALRVREVSARTLRGAVADLLAGGGRVRALFAAGAAGDREVRYVVGDAEGDLVLRCPVVQGAAPTVVDLVPALAWDEREARDLYGVIFAGHEPHRALVSHPDALSDWTTPVHGDDVHQIAVGPIHAGVIESGHFRFHAVGERILAVDVQLFYKHRGLERAAEGLPPADALPVVQRACAACAVTNAVAYAHAVEQAEGLWPDDDLRRTRTVLLECERLYNHLHDIGAVCSGIGFAAGTMTFAGLKERAQRVNRLLTGHRFLFDAVAVGGGRASLAGADVERARAEIGAIGEEFGEVWRQVLFDASVRDRLAGAGVLSHGDAVRLGAVGPSGRASGVRDDVREDSPRLWYAGFGAAQPADPRGDVAARVKARAVELIGTFAILDGILADPPGPGATHAGAPAEALGIGRVESPRGETVCAVEIGDGVVRRVHLRTGSFANWPSVARAAAGGIVPEFPLVNKSFELCYACVDR